MICIDWQFSIGALAGDITKGAQQLQQQQRRHKKPTLMINGGGELHSPCPGGDRTQFAASKGNGCLVYHESTHSLFFLNYLQLGDHFHHIIGIISINIPNHY